MKKALLAIGLMLALVTSARAETKTMQKIRSGTKPILTLDTIVGSDSIKLPLSFFPEDQKGYYNFWYRVKKLHANDSIKVVLRYEETIDTSYGWYNRVVIDSIRYTPESTLVIDSSFIHGTDFGQFIFDGWGDAADSITAEMGFQAIPK